MPKKRIANTTKGISKLTPEQIADKIGCTTDGQERALVLEAVRLALAQSAQEERPVLVTTEFRGVFFGYATDTTGDPIHLRSARCCIRWEGIKGFMALATTGPGDKCKIGPAASIDLRKITSVTEVSAEAVLAWERGPWAS